MPSYHETLCALLGAKVGRRVADRYTPAALATAGEALDADLGAKTAGVLRAALDLGAYARVASATTRLDSSRAVALHCADLARLTEERFVVLLCDCRQGVIERVEIARGGPAGCAADVRAILGVALRRGAAGLVAVHNHPAGDPTPSQLDVEFTRALRAACAAVECPLLDHVIVASGGLFSFLDAGLMGERFAHENARKERL
jgi:DNA repair protein RadC